MCARVINFASFCKFLLDFGIVPTKMDNPERLAKKNKTKTQNNMGWTPLS
jgi:hypothetical protein